MMASRCCLTARGDLNELSSGLAGHRRLRGNVREVRFVKSLVGGYPGVIEERCLNRSKALRPSEDLV
jgi:hypothetical protein